MIARRYAKALLGLALKDGQEEIIRKDIVNIGYLSKQKKYFEFFTNRLIAAADKIELLAGFHDLTKSFLKLVIANKREEYLYLISLEYVKMLNKLKNIEDVEVSSRMPLTSDQKKKLVLNLGKYLGKKVNPSFRTDKKMIGGARIEYGDKVMDGTVSSRLKGLLEQMTEQ